MMKKNKLIMIFIMVIMIIIVLLVYLKKMPVLMIDLTNQKATTAIKYAKTNQLKLTVTEAYDNHIKLGYIIKQNINQRQVIKKDNHLSIIVSLGPINTQAYHDNKINELGLVPIMMYHGIYNLTKEETKYLGGNVDASGYHRTSEAFRQDLEFYYANNYRVIRLKDYIAGKIDVPFKSSPIILTFDDGLANNIFITGLNQKGDLIIDPNSAVGIMESYKKKYPDFKVTATFFLNRELFHQSKYNEQIIKWLINHNYDIGNHGYDHAHLDEISAEAVNLQIGKVYNLLNTIIPNQYLNIVSLPFGSPYKQSHPNFKNIINGSYDNLTYQTESTLRVGWQSNYSPFSASFDKNFIKRIRAYDNNGTEFDIHMNFKNLETNRYISDGNVKKIVIPESNLSFLKKENTLEVITY